MNQKESKPHSYAKSSSKKDKHHTHRTWRRPETGNSANLPQGCMGVKETAIKRVYERNLIKKELITVKKFNEQYSIY